MARRAPVGATGRPGAGGRVAANLPRLLVLGAALLHALFYATFMPAWSILNEPQQVPLVRPWWFRS